MVSGRNAYNVIPFMSFWGRSRMRVDCTERPLPSMREYRFTVNDNITKVSANTHSKRSRIYRTRMWKGTPDGISAFCVYQRREQPARYELRLFERHGGIFDRIRKARNARGIFANPHTKSSYRIRGGSRRSLWSWECALQRGFVAPAARSHVRFSPRLERCPGIRALRPRHSSAGVRAR